MEYIITFKNTNHAIKAEQHLLAGNFRIGILPLPPQIRAGCGICLRINPEQWEAAWQALTDLNMGGVSIFSRIPECGSFIYTEVAKLN